MAATTLKIGELLLDSSNPRIGTAANQREALQKILDDQEEKLFALAEDIVNEGLSPIDRLLVVAEQPGAKRYIALEGNRRVAALKILDNPSILTGLHLKAPLQRRFEALAATFARSTVEPIAAYRVSTREEGNRWILLRHTGENEGRGVVSWSGLAASRFRGSDPALQALDFVRSFGDLSPEERDKLGEGFPITTLDRLLSSKTVRKKLGFDVKDGKLVSGLPASELLKPLSKIVDDLAHKEKNVSDLKNATQQAAYVDEFDKKDLPDLGKAGKSRAIESIKVTDFSGGTKVHRTHRKRTANPAERKVLVARGTNLNVTNTKVAAIFHELQRLKVDDTPHAIAVLLRVFLELSVDSYMEKEGIPLTHRDANNKSYDKKLGKKVEEVINHLVAEGNDKKDFRGVSRALSVPHSPLSIDLLHDYIHNRFTNPKTRDLLSAWDDAQRFFERVWP